MIGNYARHLGTMFYGSGSHGDVNHHGQITMKGKISFTFAKHFHGKSKHLENQFLFLANLRNGFSHQGILVGFFEGGGNRPLHPFRPPWQLNWQAFHGSGLLHELFESPGRGPLWLPWEQDIAWELPWKTLVNRVGKQSIHLYGTLLTFIIHSSSCFGDAANT